MIRMQPRVARRYDFAPAPSHPQPLIVEFHEMDCPCCVPPSERQLTFVHLGLLAWAGIVVGSTIAFAIDPHGAWHALASCFGGR